MKIRLRRLALLCGCVTVLLCMFSLGANAYTYEKMPSDWENLKVTVGNVTMPLERYPAGAWFDPEKHVMTATEAADYGINKEVDLRGWECVGFARYVYTALFYKFPENATIDTNLAYSSGSSYAYTNMIKEVLGTDTLQAGFSAATIKELFTSCRPGAVMRLGGHSMVLMAIFDDGCLVYDANFSSDNEVSVRMYTWDSFVSTFGSRNMTALQMPKYYPGYFYSTGGSQDGYTIDTSTAGTYEVYNCTELNVRVSPNTWSTKAGTIKAGTTVEVLGTYNGWAKIFYENTWRWVYMDYLRPVTVGVNVTFDANGGTISYTSGTYQAGSAFGSLPTGTKTDRTLIGWTYGGATYTETSTVPNVQELLLKAQWCILEYQDVPEDTWFAPYVERGYQMGLISRDTLFNPASNTLRAHIVAVLGREYERETGQTLPDVNCESFTDVLRDSFYDKYVAWGAETGIVQGMGNSTFGPNLDVTREQIATFLYRLAKYQNMTSGSYDASALASFKDDEKVSAFAREAMSWAVNVGILQGDDLGYLNPQNSARRCEMVTMFVRFADYADQNKGRADVRATAVDEKAPAESDETTEPAETETPTEAPAEAAEPAGESEEAAAPTEEPDETLDFVGDDFAAQPDAETTWGEALTLLGQCYEAQEGQLPEAGEVPYTDVEPEAEYAAYLTWGLSTGVVEAASDTEFGPDRTLSEASLIQALYRMACALDETQTTAVEESLLDGFSGLEQEHQAAVCWAVNAGMLSPEDGLEPAVTHGQMIELLSRYLEQIG